MRKIWDDIKTLLTAPIAGQVDIIHLWLLVGIVLLSLVVWGFILRHVKLAAQEI